MEILSNIQVGPDIYKLKIKSTEICNNAKPGQFVHIKVNKNNNDPLLRRPLSIFDRNQKGETISLLYKIYGRGTKILSEYKKGEKIDILGPLGNNFSTNIKDKKILVIAGGMGAAPLYFLTKALSASNKISVILGSENKYKLSYIINSFMQLDLNLYSTTISEKNKNVIDYWLELKENGLLNNINKVFTCGPRPMLKTIQQICENDRTPAEVSLEERMGCGIGVCLSCICETIEGNKRLCQEGPVLPLSEVNFDEENRYQC
ncbi:MAG: dihydroorotate dehydrogenase electron transfer subunit [Bacillota bacterium]